jgi:hypothetical protein
MSRALKPLITSHAKAGLAVEYKLIDCLSRIQAEWSLTKFIVSQRRFLSARWPRCRASFHRAVGRNLRGGCGRAAVVKGPALAEVTGVDEHYSIIPVFETVSVQRKRGVEHGR